MEQLHATILIAWAENGSGRSKSMYIYCFDCSKVVISSLETTRLPDV